MKRQIYIFCSGNENHENKYIYQSDLTETCVLRLWSDIMNLYIYICKKRTCHAMRATLFHNAINMHLSTLKIYSHAECEKKS